MNLGIINTKLKNARIGIAGVGGLGSNCAVALARAGIGFLRIIDFDTVSKSNLNRQYFFRQQIGFSKVDALKDTLHRINAKVHVENINKKLDSNNVPSLFDDIDIIIEALDEAVEKKKFIETCLLHFPNKPIVSGMGIASWGNSNTLKVSQFENLYICGDMKTEVTEDILPYAPRVAIVANMQANTVLEILLDEKKAK